MRRAKTTSLALLALAAATAPAHAAQVTVSPVPGSRVAAPHTQLSFRGVAPAALGVVTVTASATGTHAVRKLAHSDGRGVSLIAAKGFKPGEQVTVTTKLDIPGATNGTYRFRVAQPAPLNTGATLAPAKRTAGDVERFRSRPDLQPARSTVVRQGPAARGYVFVAPQTGPVQNGPLMLDRGAGVAWFLPLPKGEGATDFRVQRYRGKPVLTWWQGTTKTPGVGFGFGRVLDSSYHEVARVRAGNGLSNDLHEFVLTGRGTALITAYEPVYWDTTPVKGGTKRMTVLNGVVQEIDIRTGAVLFQWDSLDHIPLGDSHSPLPRAKTTPWDYFHINSVAPDRDGSLIVSARNTWAIYKINRATGQVIWKLGGKRSDFKMGPGTRTAWQHHARVQPNGLMTIFDNGAGPPPAHKQSRVITVRLDTANRTATMVSEMVHAPSLLAFYEGSGQPLERGHVFTGWGQHGFFTEFDSSGHTVFDARFVASNSSYRAFRFPWRGHPRTNPTVVAFRDGSSTSAYASWNGATEVKRWRVRTGDSPSALTSAATAAKRRFETHIRVPGTRRYVEVEALDGHGRVLGRSRPQRLR